MSEVTVQRREVTGRTEFKRQRDFGVEDVFRQTCL